ncbi:MAG: Flagellar P-ring protein precursor [Pseudomonadota bacterium]
MTHATHFIRLLCIVLALMATNSWADRVKDLASVAAGRSNQLIGYGLVVGLQGTGDGTDVSFTTRTLQNMLSRLGVSSEGPLSDFEPSLTAGRVNLQNIAAVMVTAELPGFAKPGQKIDVNVSAVGKASSLRGGTLLITSLRGVDGEVYALAQGPLNALGASASAAGSSVTIGVPTAARISGGATVERTVNNPFERAEYIVMNVRESDFTTTMAIVNAINKNFGDGIARAIDGMSLSVKAPEDLSQRVGFMSMIENLDVQPGEPPARVVVNSRTGTVVISRNVRVTAAAVSHGSITVSVAATNEVSQPNALAQGQTTPVQNAEVAVTEAKNPMFLFQPGVDLRQIVDAVNQVGATPNSLIAILEALKSSGSLRADLIII